jgi:hypothetical protein
MHRLCSLADARPRQISRRGPGPRPRPRMAGDVASPRHAVEGAPPAARTPTAWTPCVARVDAWSPPRAPRLVGAPRAPQGPPARPQGCTSEQALPAYFRNSIQAITDVLSQHLFLPKR